MAVKGFHILLAVSVIIGGGLSQAATARLTAEDKAAVPPDVLAAYAEARDSSLYVCPRMPFVSADRQLSELTNRIRIIYKADFDAPHDDDIILRLYCPSPDEYPDFEERLQAHWEALERLGRLLGCHPRPIEGVQACDRRDARALSDPP